MRRDLDPLPGIFLPELISFLKTEKYRFVTPTPATVERNNQRPGSESARSLSDAFGWSRPFQPSLLPSSLFALLRDGEIVIQSGPDWKSSVRASTLGGELF